MTRAIFDSRMAERLSDFFPSVATIEEDTGAEQDDYGNPIPGWTTFQADLACAVAPSGGEEVKQSDQTYVVSEFKISFASDQSSVTEAMRIIVTGENAGTYDILSVETSSHGQVTRMLTNEVT